MQLQIVFFFKSFAMQLLQDFMCCGNYYVYIMH